MTVKQILIHMIKNQEISIYKIFNFTYGYLNYLFKLPNAKNYPSILMFEPTNLCNLKCPLCPTGNNSLKAPKGYLEFENYKKVIDQIGKYLLNLTLWNFGEPFLNKEIYNMISYARKMNIFVRISTNGHFLENEENIVNLINSGVDNLIIALDGASQKTFSKYRENGNFDKVIKNIEKITLLKTKLNKQKPFIEIQFIVMKHNEHEVPFMKDLASKLNVNQVKIKTVNIEMDLSKDIKGMANNYLPKSKKYTRNERDKKKKQRMKSRCKRLWLSSVINWDGSVVACCYDPNRNYYLGNAFEDGFMKVWNNNKYQDFRRLLTKQKSNIAMCKNCTGNLMGLDIDNN